MTPKVTIIVPVYNVSRFIEKCTRSLLEQTFHYLEYIFVDDSTPDNSIEILENVIEQYPNRKANVNIIHHESNRGVSVARNTGLNVAKGDYILFVDSDDHIDFNMIELMYNKALTEAVDIVVCDFDFEWSGISKVCKQDFSTNSYEYTKMLLSGEVLPGLPNKLIKRSLFGYVHSSVIDGISLGEDYLTTSILSYYANGISKIDKPLYHYIQINANSAMTNVSQRSIDSLVFVLNYLNDYYKQKPDGNYFHKSILQGQLRKKIFMLMSSNYSKLKQMADLFPESTTVLYETKLPIQEKIVINLANKKLFICLRLFLFFYKNIFELIQIAKGRRFR